MTNNNKENKIPSIRLIISRNIPIGPGSALLWKQYSVQGPYWRIYWNDTPGGFVTCENREIELTPNRVVALSPNAIYSTRAETLINHYYIHCFIGQPFSEIKGKMFVWENDDLIKQASSLAVTTNSQMSSMRTQMELQAYILSVLLAIPQEQVPKHTPYSQKITQAIAIMKNDPKASNDDIAKKIGMSRNGFLFLFKKETGSSPQSYARELRLNEACIMLHYSNKSVEEIADATGFYDRYHFSRIFKQYMGSTPIQFRKRQYS